MAHGAGETACAHDRGRLDAQLRLDARDKAFDLCRSTDHEARLNGRLGGVAKDVRGRLDGDVRELRGTIEERRGRNHVVE